MSLKEKNFKLEMISQVWRNMITRKQTCLVNIAVALYRNQAKMFAENEF